MLGTYSLSVIPNYQQALDEVARVLKPGGTLVVLDGKSSNGLLRYLNPLVKLLARAPVSDLTSPLTFLWITTNLDNKWLSYRWFGDWLVECDRTDAVFWCIRLKALSSGPDSVAQGILCRSAHCLMEELRK